MLIGFILAVAVFSVAVVYAIVFFYRKYKRERILTPNRALILGTFLSALVLLCPIYLKEFEDHSLLVAWEKSILLSVQHAARLFALDGDFKEYFTLSTLIKLFKNEAEANLPIYYSVFGSVLYCFAPILTVTFVLTFFQNFAAYGKYWTSFWKETHIFSELNEKSLTLAKNIDDIENKVEYNGKKEKKRGKKRYKFIKKALIVFTDVLPQDDERSLDLVEEAREIGAILFSRDLESIKYRCKHSLRKVNFYLLSDDEEDDESEKIGHAEGLMKKYGGYNVVSFGRKKEDNHNKLYIFSNSIESKCFLDAYPEEQKKLMRLDVIRVNDIRALIYYNLNEKGLRLFEKAQDIGDETREVTAVVVGMGQYGMEVVKALLWYCQVPGYRVKITAYDERENIDSIFKAACPEIQIGTAVDATGDMRYTLNLCQGKFGTEEFYKAIEDTNVGIRDGAYVFVCLGSDRDNITAATGIRNRFAQYHIYPDIETVVYDSSLKKIIAKDFAKQEIGIIGDLESFYSMRTVINSNLILKGLDVHKRWDGSKYDFYMNDYNFYSSLASALHRELRAKIIEHEKCKEVFPFYEKYDKPTKELFGKLNNNDSIKALSKEMVTVSDHVYIKLAQLHYRKLTVDDRRKVLDILQGHLQDYMKKKKVILTIPMLDDTKNYYSGYEECIQNVGTDEHTKKMMRMLFDAIVEWIIRDENDDERTRQLVHALEYQALSDEDKIAVREYVNQQVGKESQDSVDIEQYIHKGIEFANVEHIRWNAYMRTEGFRRTCKMDKNYRKYKLHYDLVPVEFLTFADCVKDI